MPVLAMLRFLRHSLTQTGFSWLVNNSEIVMKLFTLEKGLVSLSVTCE